MNIVLAGNPNSGKTTLFNLLTGKNQRIGNWAGVTVEKKTGQMTLAGKTIDITDLPGTYSLNNATDNRAIDERIAVDAIMNNPIDLIINVIDSSNLERNLYLTTQLVEMQRPIIVILNMTDIATKRGIHIDYLKLRHQLGCQVIPMVSAKKKGIAELKKAIRTEQRQKTSTHLAIPFYNPLLETAISDLSIAIGQTNTITDHKNLRWHAISLLEHPSNYLESGNPFSDTTELRAKQQIVNDKLSHWQQQITAELNIDIATLLAENRYQYIQTILDHILIKNKGLKHHVTDVIDKVVLNRFLGLPIFLLIMYLMFEFSITIGGAIQPLFDDGSRTLFIDFINALGNTLHLPLWLTAIFSQGIGLGINTVVTFIPQIGCLFLFLSFIENSGYMARATFVMDRFMQLIGLPGKSFIPLIIGFGCNVPAIMAARTLDSRRDRLLTVMMSPFMSCGARLAIFAVFSTAFFGNHGSLVVFLLYLTGIFVAMLTGFILKFTVLKGEASPFILELPPYHLPLLRILLRHTWLRLKRFVFRAGKIIIPVCLVIGCLNAIQINGHINPNGSKNSVLSKVGRIMTPVLYPMGVKDNNWPATVGLLTGILAKEVVIGTMNTLYSQNNNLINTRNHFNLWDGLKGAVDNTYNSLTSISTQSLVNPFSANEADHDMSYTAMGAMEKGFSNDPLAAFAYLLFILLYVPCVSTIAVTKRETQSNAWTWASVIWSFSIAYVAGVGFYQIATLGHHPLTSLAWILGLITYTGLLVAIMIYISGKQARDPQMIFYRRL